MQKMMQEDEFQILLFRKVLYEVKASDLQLSFNIF